MVQVIQKAQKGLVIQADQMVLMVQENQSLQGDLCLLLYPVGRLVQKVQKDPEVLELLQHLCHLEALLVRQDLQVQLVQEGQQVQVIQMVQAVQTDLMAQQDQRIQYLLVVPEDQKAQLIQHLQESLESNKINSIVGQAKLKMPGNIVSSQQLIFLYGCHHMLIEVL